MSETGRRRFLAAAGALAAAPLAMAQNVRFPFKPVRIVVPYTPGAFTDQIARVLAQKLGDTWKSPVVVENRPGAGTVLGSDVVAKAPPDGHTLLLVGFAFAISPSLQAKLPYDPIADFAPVALCAGTPNLLVVHPDLPVKSVADLIALAKSKPGEIPFASAGPGSSTHLSMEMLKQRAGIDLVHVPYKGSAPAALDVMGGRVPVTFDNVPNILPHVKAGKLRAIAVTTPRRFALLPQVPTVADTVPGFEVGSWFGLSAAARTPRDVIERINQEVNRILLLPDVKTLFRDQGVETIGGSPEQFALHVKSQIAKWAPVVRTAGLAPGA